MKAVMKNKPQTYRKPTTAFGDKLLQAMGNQRPAYRRPKRPPVIQPAGFHLPPMRSIGRDGADHINCTSRGVTKLGNQLATQAIGHFVHRDAGPFNTIEGFIWFLKTENDVFRSLSGLASHLTGRGLKKGNCVHIRHDLLMLLTADAYWQRIEQNPALKKTVLQSDAPFDMYNVDQNGVRMRLFNGQWLVHILELIRDALKNEQAYPDFYKLFDRRSPFSEVNWRKNAAKRYQIEDTSGLTYGEYVYLVTKAYFGYMQHNHVQGLDEQKQSAEVVDVNDQDQWTAPAIEQLESMHAELKEDMQAIIDHGPEVREENLSEQTMTDSASEHTAD